MNKDKRQHHRISDPIIRLKFGSDIFQSVNWSMGGVLINEYEGELRTGALLTIKEIGLARGVMTPVNISARVIRNDGGANNLAVQFLSIDPAAYAILQKLIAKKTEAIKGLPLLDENTS